MKIIDKNGKLFGIINIIDLAVILLVALLLYGGYNRSNEEPIVENGPVTESPETVTSTVTLEIPRVRDVTVDSIEIGDNLYLEGESAVFGRIVEKRVEPYTEIVATDDGRLVLAEVPERYTVILDLESSAEERERTMIVIDARVAIGESIKLQNKKVTLNSTVLGVEVE